MLTSEEFALAKAKLLGLDAPTATATPPPQRTPESRPPPSRPQPAPPPGKVAQPPSASGGSLSSSPSPSPKPAAKPKTAAAVTPKPSAATPPPVQSDASSGQSVKALASAVSGAVMRNAIVPSLSSSDIHLRFHNN